MVDVRLLGPFEVRRAGAPWPSAATAGVRYRRSSRSRPNETVSADVLAARLWSGATPGGASGTLQAYVSNLRQVLEPDRAPRAQATILTSASQGYLLVLPDGARDIDRFEADRAAARRALGAGDTSSAVRWSGGWRSGRSSTAL